MRVSIVFLATLLAPAAAEACSRHGHSTSFAEFHGLLVLAILALSYPVWIFRGAFTDPVPAGPKGGQSFHDHPWTRGALFMAYGLIAIGGIVVLETFVAQQGIFASPRYQGRAPPYPLATLLCYLAWFALILWRTTQALYAPSPGPRRLRRLAGHPICLLVTMGGPALYLLGSWTHGLSLLDGTLLLFPGALAVALIFHDVVAIVHWSRARLVALVATGEHVDLDELRPGPAPACPVCAAGIGGPAHVCPSCSALHHAECYDFLGGCAVYGCSGRSSTWNED